MAKESICMIYFLIPVFNEEVNIPVLAANLKKYGTESSFFVFSDDGSIDRSRQAIAEEFGMHSFVILGDGSNHGPGHAFQLGFEWILNHASDSDKIVTLEADNTSDLDILPIMLTLVELKYDLVLASPYAQGGGFSQTSALRKLLSFFANMIFRLAFDIKVLTLSSFYRVYRVSIVRQVKSRFGRVIAEKGFLCMLEILVKIIATRGNIIEVPMILHSDKRAGKSKMKMLRTSMEYVRFLLLSRILRK